MSRTMSHQVTLSAARGTMPAFGAFAPLRLTAGLLLAACGAGEPDAYGNFEATEVTVAAEVGGQLGAGLLEQTHLYVGLTGSGCLAPDEEAGHRQTLCPHRPHARCNAQWDSG